RAPGVAQRPFRICHLDMCGGDAFHAIVNTPQAAILAVGRILDRIVAVDGEAVVRPTMTVSLSFDHRVVDGAEGARFLDTLAALVEEPAGLVRWSGAGSLGPSLGNGVADGLGSATSVRRGSAQASRRAHVVCLTLRRPWSVA